MKCRCECLSAAGYENYGGRGISLCDQWHDFEAFYRDMGDPPSNKHSIDRIDVNGNYEPNNCRWATAVEQMRNTRVNAMLTFNGITKCLTEWSHVVNIPPQTIKHRISRGWSAERALTTRPAKTRPTG